MSKPLRLITSFVALHMACGSGMLVTHMAGDNWEPYLCGIGYALNFFGGLFLTAIAVYLWLWRPTANS